MFGEGVDQGLVDSWGIGAVLGGEAGVAGGHGETVGLSDGGVGDDRHLEIEITNHAADDGELLEVFFTEHGGIAPSEVEEFEHHGADTIEVAGSGRAAEMFGKTALDHRDRAILGIHGGVVRQEYPVGSVFLTHREIRFDGAGVMFKIARAVELDGIHKYGNDDRSLRSRLLACQGDQRSMTRMQGSHRRHKDNRMGGGPYLRPQIGFRRTGPHVGETLNFKL